MTPSGVQKPLTLILVGGGHSHAIALREWALKPLAGVQVILITEEPTTPYSGMLPGYVAGHYRFDDCHIDLGPLAQAAQAQFYVDRVIGLDLESQQVRCVHHPPFSFDWLSIDIGSTPKLPKLPGVLDYGVAVKPWRGFLQQWQQLVTQVSQRPTQPIEVGVIGGGAGGVELALTIQYQLQQVLRRAGQPCDHLRMHLVHQGPEVMPEHPSGLRHRFYQLLCQRGVKVHLQQRVTQVQPGLLLCASGLHLACDRSFWVTGAAAAPWPHQAGLATDLQGFIQVRATLQSLSHPQVFATGDIAAMVESPRPKAGVFAVRQGKPLAENLRRAVQGQPLQRYQPQSRFLSLISTGDRQAMLSWGTFAWPWESTWLWRWKDTIDRQFMNQFRRESLL
ncbi:MAG: FAD-dependent oxidoreductase [Acaryochloridaceae cyanobacterium SU_2_1]|nr:FAD-dependent oxidoreductase [Acaryochloridaceae cyanobacterium SU_2_1]